MKPYEMTADEIVEKQQEIAIIPVGSIEQHGPHLPVMTDWAIASWLGENISRRLDAFAIPALPISTCREHMGKRGSVWMEPTTFYQMMTDIILSLKTQGFKKVVILQCHGGIFIMPPLVRDLNARHNPDLMVALVDFGSGLGPRTRERGIFEVMGELHAGESETSMILHIAPETVHMDRAVDFIPDIPRPYLGYASIFRASPTGVWGYPSYATAEKGKKGLELYADLAIEEIAKAFSYMEEKEKFGYSFF
jgi:creatinine amidohydrolase